MSVQALSWVFDHSPTKGAQRLVLLSIANHAGASPSDGAWEAWPGVATLQREAGVGRERTVIDALSKLVEQGALQRVVNGAPDERIRKDRRPNLYRVLLTDGVSCGDTRCRWCRGDAPRHDGVTLDDERGDALRRDGVTLPDATGCRKTTGEPLVQPSVEPEQQPSGEPSATDVAAKATALDPVKRHAHELTVLAFEQPVKPVLRGSSNGSAFPAVMALVERQLRAGSPVQTIRAAITAGVDVWTTHGLQTAVAQQRSHRGGQEAARQNLIDEITGGRR